MEIMAVMGATRALRRADRDLHVNCDQSKGRDLGEGICKGLIRLIITN